MAKSNEIEVNDKKSVVLEEEKSTEKASIKNSKVKIRLPRLRGTKVDQRVFVAVNGEPYMIVRGEEVEVPDYIVECLKEAQIQLDNADKMIAGKAANLE